MSGSKRDRDRATEAFRRWARLGCPDAEIIRKSKWKRAADLLACASVFAALSKSEPERTNAAGGEIIRAVRAIYMQEPQRPLRRGEVGERVTKFGMELPADRSTVFRWLHRARTMWAQFRRRTAHGQ